MNYQTSFRSELMSVGVKIVELSREDIAKIANLFDGLIKGHKENASLLKSLYGISVKKMDANTILRVRGSILAMASRTI